MDLDGPFHTTRLAQPPSQFDFKTPRDNFRTDPSSSLPDPSASRLSPQCSPASPPSSGSARVPLDPARLLPAIATLFFPDSKSIDAQEDFSNVAEVQRALRGEGGTPRSRTVRVTVSGIGHNGAVYRGCPTCQISERRSCGHAYGIAEWLFRLKLIVKDPPCELEVTAWETAKQILGMELDDFVAVHV
ncbi:hypothetical protein R1sor_008921 [Riccia sorocarpa]|uniref:Uncharacterized protein n=1 Tax=Riccia sorocarpa TaxID=122646 RepID=A0ABD3H738_9MARC